MAVTGEQSSILKIKIPDISESIGDKMSALLMPKYISFWSKAERRRNIHKDIRTETNKKANTLLFQMISSGG